MLVDGAAPDRGRKCKGSRVVLPEMPDCILSRVCPRSACGQLLVAGRELEHRTAAQKKETRNIGMLVVNLYVLGVPGSWFLRISGAECPEGLTFDGGVLCRGNRQRSVLLWGF